MQPNQGPDEFRFRVISIDGKRHGIRLEMGFWSALAEVAADGGRRINDLIGEYSERFGNLGNLTAAIRLGLLLEIHEKSQKPPVNLDLVAGLVAASPTPSFALSGNKQIVAYNAPFLALIQARLSDVPADSIASGMKLQLETPLHVLMAQLKASERDPIAVNYAINVKEKVLRGRLNAVMADSAGQGIVLCYIYS